MSSSNRDKPLQQIKVTQKQFFYIKERLDYYMLPTNFPIEAAPLLSKILNKLDNKIQSKNNSHFGFETQPKEKHYFNDQLILDLAFKNQMSKLIKENNKLHLEVMGYKQQITTFKHQLSKILIKQTNNQKQNQLLSEFQANQQIQLKQQLTQLKYKYNQLMDFIHGDQNKQKQYIKHLLKYKKISQKQQIQNNNSAEQKSRRVSNNGNRERGISENGYKRPTQVAQIQMLKQKVQYRQKQILRLQAKIQFDGLNVNTIIKNFKEDCQMQKYLQQQQNLQYLTKQNKRLTDQVNKIKRQGGDKQALREQIQKNKQNMKDLVEENNKLKNKTRQIKFDQQKNRKNLQIKLNKTAKDIKHIQQQKLHQKQDNVYNKNKISYLQNRNSQLQQYLKMQKQKNLEKDIQISVLEKRIQGQKLMIQYENQKLRQTYSQLKESLFQLQKNKAIYEKQSIMLKRQLQLKEAAIQNLENITQQLIKKNNNSLIESSGFLDRTVIQTNMEVMRRQITDLKMAVVKYENAYHTIQRDYKSVSMINDQLKIQVQLFKQQNGNLSLKVMESNKWEQKLQNQKQQKDITYCLYEKQRQWTIKLSAQLNQLQSSKDKIAKQLSNCKNQLSHVLLNQKNKERQLQQKLALIQQNLLIKSHSLQQKQARILTLQKDLIDHSQKIRQVNKEASMLDEQLHKTRIEKTRLQRKNSELNSDLSLMKQKQHKKVSLSQLQHKSQIQKLWRQKQNLKVLVQELQRQNLNLLSIKKQLQAINSQTKQKNQILFLKQEDMLNKQKLYIMEIEELKHILNQNNML